MKLHICPGVCGLETTVTAVANEDQEVTLTVDSACKAVKQMAEALEQPLDGYETCFVKPGEGPVYEVADHLLHGACPIPAAFIKCVEAECGLALPRSVKMEFIE
ncbi:hypothetical protein P261_01876 [Lachnospiraceae bacterium TWA4]|nr:hypothetical protein P261_01876 [Lachnospiraceae bacterium TWA4]